MKTIKGSKKFISFKSRGFTDKLYFVNFCFTWIFTAICFLLTIFSGRLGIEDMSIVSYGIPACWAELAIHSTAVIAKATKENLNKFKDFE